MDTTDKAKADIAAAEIAIAEADANANAINSLVATVEDHCRLQCWDAALRANSAVAHAAQALNDAKETLACEPYAVEAAEYAKAVATAAATYTDAMRRAFTTLAAHSVTPENGS